MPNLNLLLNAEKTAVLLTDVLALLGEAKIESHVVTRVQELLDEANDAVGTDLIAACHSYKYGDSTFVVRVESGLENRDETVGLRLMALDSKTYELDMEDEQLFTDVIDGVEDLRGIVLADADALEG